MVAKTVAVDPHLSDGSVEHGEVPPSSDQEDALQTNPKYQRRWLGETPDSATLTRVIKYATSDQELSYVSVMVDSQPGGNQTNTTDESDQELPAFEELYTEFFMGDSQPDGNHDDQTNTPDESDQELSAFEDAWLEAREGRLV